MFADVILAFVFTLLVSASARKDIEKCDDPFYEWTKYFDSDDPGHSGDFETLKHHLAYYPDDVCENPIGIDVRLLNGEHHTSAYEVTSISLTHGFACFNKHQRRNWGVSKCSDYKVRYCCPKKVVCEDVGREFTPFFDVSSGEGIDQMETVNNIRAITGLDFVVCDEPTAVDVRLVDGTALMTGGNVLEVTNLGLVCIESQQPAGKSCKDYKVRFCCPKRPPVPSTCGDGREWTEFFSIDQPFTSPSDPGDLELIADIRNQRRGELCRPEQITAIEVQLMNGVPAAESGDPTFTGLDFGFVCLNANQDNLLCHDYKARFCCPEKIRIPPCSGESEWSKFLDRDDPTGRDDNELLPFQRLRKPELCEVSLAIDFRLAGGVRLDYYDDNFVQLNQQFGLLCRNSDQNDNRCDDYEVRFCCPKHLPEQECEGDGNQWTVWYNSDDPSESGDIECLQNLRADNPGEICENPSAINAEIASIEFPYYLTNEKVKISRNSGLTCLRSDQTDNSCVDYRVRFCCPKRFTHPVCQGNNNHWTEWVNRDSPSGNYDLETLKDILDGNFDVCTKPTSVEARLVATEEPYFQANEVVSISPSLGLLCQNDLQVDGMCENYEVRFCCPDVSMECNTEDGNEWTAYFDVDGDQLNGESESLYLHRVNNPELNICKYPSAVQARQTDNPTEGIEDQRDQIDISPAGLFCTNEPHSKCKDYEVRYCCPMRFLHPTCAAGSQWTAYTSNDTPDGPGDIEVSIPCSSPSSIQARLVDNQAPYQTGEDFVLLSPAGGLTCLNDQQLDGECNNYEVRFCCPE